MKTDEYGSTEVHYRFNKDDLALKRGIHRSCFEWDEAACGNGAPIQRLNSTRKEDKVTCDECKKALNKLT